MIPKDSPHDTILAHVPLFSGLSGAEIQLVLNHSTKKTVAKNTIIISEGDQSASLYVIITGKVKVFLQDGEGKEVVLNYQGPGEYFGELALLDNAPRSASVMAVQKSTFLVVSKQEFKQMLSGHPDIAFALIKGLVVRLRLLTENVKDLALTDVYGRVVKLLSGLAQLQAGKMVIANGPTQQDIANRVGASREMVGRILRDLTTGGYLRMEGKNITINDKLPPGW
jgi:CRP/FNR family cyclic AMP-dependent transcriptional regulator